MPTKSIKYCDKNRNSCNRSVKYSIPNEKDENLKETNSMDDLIYWNACKVMEANPDIDLRTALMECKQILDTPEKMASYTGMRLIETPEKRYLCSMLLAWNALGKDDVDLLVETVVRKMAAKHYNISCYKHCEDTVGSTEVDRKKSSVSFSGKNSLTVFFANISQKQSKCGVCDKPTPPCHNASKEPASKGNSVLKRCCATKDSNTSTCSDYPGPSTSATSGLEIRIDFESTDRDSGCKGTCAKTQKRPTNPQRKRSQGRDKRSINKQSTACTNKPECIKAFLDVTQAGQNKNQLKGASSGNLCLIKKASMDLMKDIEVPQCFASTYMKRLNELEISISSLQERCQALAKREADRVKLVSRAEKIWNDMEASYQRKIKHSEQKENDTWEQIQHVVDEKKKCQKARCDMAQVLERHNCRQSDMNVELSDLRKLVASKKVKKKELQREMANLDALLTETQCQKAQSERDYKFQLEAHRRKLNSLKMELDSQNALNADAERTLKNELTNIKRQIEIGKSELSNVEKSIVSTKERNNKFKVEKTQKYEAMVESQAVYNSTITNLTKQLVEKQKELEEAKHKEVECKCKLPVPVACQAKKTPSIMATGCCCKDLGEIIAECGCTSLKTKLMMHLLDFWFDGFRDDILQHASLIPCEALLCLKQNFNWDTDVVVKPLLKECFEVEFMKELEIALTTAVESYRGIWIQPTCIEEKQRVDQLISFLDKTVFEDSPQVEEFVDLEFTFQQTMADATYDDTSTSNVVKSTNIEENLSFIETETAQALLSSVWGDAQKNMYHLQTQLDNLCEETVKRSDLQQMEQKIEKIISNISKPSVETEVVENTKHYSSLSKKKYQSSTKPTADFKSKRSIEVAKNVNKKSFDKSDKISVRTAICLEKPQDKIGKNSVTLQTSNQHNVCDSPLVALPNQNVISYNLREKNDNFSDNNPADIEGNIEICITKSTQTSSNANVAPDHVIISNLLTRHSIVMKHCYNNLESLEKKTSYNLETINDKSCNLLENEKPDEYIFSENKVISVKHKKPTNNVGSGNLNADPHKMTPIKICKISKQQVHVGLDTAREIHKRSPVVYFSRECGTSPIKYFNKRGYEVLFSKCVCPNDFDIFPKKRIDQFKKIQGPIDSPPRQKNDQKKMAEEMILQPDLNRSPSKAGRCIQERCPANKKDIKNQSSKGQNHSSKELNQSVRDENQSEKDKNQSAKDKNKSAKDKNQSAKEQKQSAKGRSPSTKSLKSAPNRSRESRQNIETRNERGPPPPAHKQSRGRSKSRRSSSDIQKFKGKSPSNESQYGRRSKRIKYPDRHDCVSGTSADPKYDAISLKSRQGSNTSRRSMKSQVSKVSYKRKDSNLKSIPESASEKKVKRHASATSLRSIASVRNRVSNESFSSAQSQYRRGPSTITYPGKHDCSKPDTKPKLSKERSVKTVKTENVKSETITGNMAGCGSDTCTCPDTCDKTKCNVCKKRISVKEEGKMCSCVNCDCIICCTKALHGEGSSKPSPTPKGDGEPSEQTLCSCPPDPIFNHNVDDRRVDKRNVDNRKVDNRKGDECICIPKAGECLCFESNFNDPFGDLATLHRMICDTCAAHSDESSDYPRRASYSPSCTSERYEVCLDKRNSCVSEKKYSTVEKASSMARKSATSETSCKVTCSMNQRISPTKSGSKTLTVRISPDIEESRPVKSDVVTKTASKTISKSASETILKTASETVSKTVRPPTEIQDGSKTIVIKELCAGSCTMKNICTMKAEIPQDILKINSMQETEKASPPSRRCTMTDCLFKKDTAKQCDMIDCTDKKRTKSEINVQAQSEKPRCSGLCDKNELKTQTATMQEKKTVSQKESSKDRDNMSEKEICQQEMNVASRTSKPSDTQAISKRTDITPCISPTRYEEASKPQTVVDKKRSIILPTGHACECESNKPPEFTPPSPLKSCYSEKTSSTRQSTKSDKSEPTRQSTQSVKIASEQTIQSAKIDSSRQSTQSAKIEPPRQCDKVDLIQSDNIAPEPSTQNDKIEPSRQSIRSEKMPSCKLSAQSNKIPSEQRDHISPPLQSQSVKVDSIDKNICKHKDICKNERAKNKPGSVKEEKNNQIAQQKKPKILDTNKKECDCVCVSSQFPEKRSRVDRTSSTDDQIVAKESKSISVDVDDLSEDDCPCCSCDNSKNSDKKSNLECVVNLPDEPQKKRTCPCRESCLCESLNSTSTSNNKSTANCSRSLSHVSSIKPDSQIKSIKSSSKSSSVQTATPKTPHSQEGSCTSKLKSSEESPAKSADKSPIQSPEKSPIKSPEKSPVKSPEKSPVKSPEKSPIKSPEKSPVKSPEKSPAISPEKSPTKSPEKSPVKSPEKSFIKSPDRTPSEVSPKRVASKKQVSDCFDGDQECFCEDSLTVSSNNITECSCRSICRCFKCSKKYNKNNKEKSIDKQEKSIEKQVKSVEKQEKSIEKHVKSVEIQEKYIEIQGKIIEKQEKSVEKYAVKQENQIDEGCDCSEVCVCEKSGGAPLSQHDKVCDCCGSCACEKKSLSLSKSVDKCSCGEVCQCDNNGDATFISDDLCECFDDCRCESPKSDKSSKLEKSCICGRICNCRGTNICCLCTGSESKKKSVDICDCTDGCRCDLSEGDSKQFGNVKDKCSCIECHCDIYSNEKSNQTISKCNCDVCDCDNTISSLPLDKGESQSIFRKSDNSMKKRQNKCICKGSCECVSK